MKMVLRWFGPGLDPVPLEYIRQIPGVSGIAGALFGPGGGEAWPEAEIAALKSRVEAAGLALEVVESVNVHEDIKLGLPSRDGYIDKYRLTLRRLAAAGVKVVCYNFMPVFDWFRTELSHRLPDGSSTMFYEAAKAQALTPEQVVEAIDKEAKGFVLPGWERERLAELRSTLAAYEGVGEEQLLANLGYFLRALMPTCEEAGIKMALHPDDPPWPIFGLPRIARDEERLARILELADSPCNGLTLCTGSLGTSAANDVPRILRRFASAGRVHFAHLRNVRRLPNGDVEECAHPSNQGSLDMYEIARALLESGFDGYVRSDHGRMIWGEDGRPGYGLYDRALGTLYLEGLMEAVEKAGARGRV